VRKHFENWTLNRSAGNEAPFAWYQFDEHQGNIVHNQIDPATNLVIPAYYSILRPLFLSSLSRDYKATSSYWQSVGINIAGFIPLGFCGFAALTLYGSKKFAIAAALALGFATSSTIEVLQWFLPTRSSGLTDILTNTLGTAIGVALFSWPGTQYYLTRFFPTGTVCNQQFASTVTREKSTEATVTLVSSKKIDVVETALSPR
jgi:VanZ family protein